MVPRLVERGTCQYSLARFVLFNILYMRAEFCLVSAKVNSLVDGSIIGNGYTVAVHVSTVCHIFQSAVIVHCHSN